MELTFKKNLKKLLKKYYARPLKRLGQNFLINKSVLKKIIQSANLNPKETVIEIGPGFGVLTQELAKRVKKVIAIEKDKKMSKILKDLLECWNVKNVEIVNKDILKLNLTPYTQKPYKIVANLPYYIVSPVLRKFLESVDVKPQQMILMVQKEVAQRICAKPPDMNLLAVSVQFYAKPEILFYVSKNSFWPKPKVDGAIIRVSSIKYPVSSINRNLFFKIVKAGFSQPRKQLVNNLSKMLKLDKEKVKKYLLKSKIDPTQRAETLDINDWIKLVRNFKK